MNKILLYITIIPILLLVSCTQSKNKTNKETALVIPKNFTVEISNFDGAAGFGNNYIIKDGYFKIISWNDYGDPEKEVFRIKLSKKILKEWTNFILELGLSSLDDIYENPNVYDGLQLTFKVSLNEFNKEVILRNMSIPKLFEICKKMNKIIPESFNKLPVEYIDINDPVIIKKLLISKHLLILNYSDFGPQARAYKLIGAEWWSWNNHGDSKPRKYDIKVIVYRGIALEAVKKLYPIVKDKKQDYRYLKYTDAIKYLNKHIGEDYSEHLIESKKKIIKKLGGL